MRILLLMALIGPTFNAFAQMPSPYEMKIRESMGDDICVDGSALSGMYGYQILQHIGKGIYEANGGNVDMPLHAFIKTKKKKFNKGDSLSGAEFKHTGSKPWLMESSGFTRMVDYWVEC